MAQIDRTEGLVGNTAMKAPCDVATTTNITLSGEQTIDGVTTSASRVLVKDQTDASENGIWVSDSGDWERAADCDGTRDIATGTLVFVVGGSTGSGFWQVTTTGDPTPGTDDIAFGSASDVLASFSAFVQTLLAAANAAAFRTLIGAAASGANSDITSLGGLTTPIPEADGGTGTTTTTGIGAGKHAIPIPVTSLTPRQTNGCAALTYTNGAANQPDVPYLAFDGAAAEYAWICFRMPEGWDEGTVTASYQWRRASGTGAANVVWGMRAVALSDNQSPATNFGTSATVTDAASTTTANMCVSGETSACTIGNTPAEGDLVFFEFFRDGANASDTLDAVDAWLTGITLYYTTNQNTDA